MIDSVAIDSARALLATAQASGVREAHVVTANFECFIAFAPGSANPMRWPPPETVSSEPEQVIVAPHVASLVGTASLGTMVSTGDIIATLRVLDREMSLAAPIAGRINTISAHVGDLLEFGDAVLGLADVR